MKYYLCRVNSVDEFDLHVMSSAFLCNTEVCHPFSLSQAVWHSHGAGAVFPEPWLCFQQVISSRLTPLPAAGRPCAPPINIEMPPSQFCIIYVSHQPSAKCRNLSGLVQVDGLQVWNLISPVEWKQEVAPWEITRFKWRLKKNQEMQNLPYLNTICNQLPCRPLS